MKQIKIAQAYNVTEGLSKDQNLSIDAKWVLYKLRKDLYSYYEFYLTESQNLFSEYETTTEGSSITFKSAKEANEYTERQAKIDEFEVETEFQRKELKLSDIPNISIQQIEALEGFIDFKPE